jgi:hypothetical protein
MMHDTRPGKERPRLAMPAANDSPEKAPAPPAPTTAPTPAPAPAKKHHASNIREFQMTDGRPIALLRDTVTFACPNKDAPDTATIVGLRNSRAVPLRISYTAFLQWWLR